MEDYLDLLSMGLWLNCNLNLLAQFVSKATKEHAEGINFLVDYGSGGGKGHQISRPPRII